MKKKIPHYCEGSLLFITNKISLSVRDLKNIRDQVSLPRNLFFHEYQP